MENTNLFAPKVESRYKTVGNCDMEIPGPFSLIIFGASGDLSKRKIFPSLYRLKKEKLLPENFFIIGTARSESKNGDFRETLRDAVKQAFPDDFDDEIWAGFQEHVYYEQMDYMVVDSYRSLRKKIVYHEKKYDTGGNRIFYLAIPPEAYENVTDHIGSVGLAKEKPGYNHIVVEKPIGSDLLSARRLNSVLGRYFREDQIYRMDHYLAKDTVQNILVFRFANSIFEPLWNRRYIDHVQITVSESIGVEHRAGYYEKSGVIRDMFQNHILQLLCLTAMEPPAVFESERVRDEKAKVLRSVRPLPLENIGDVAVLGQYGPGKVGGRDVIGYRSEPGVAPDSVTPTYAAIKVYIDNWRWNGVPFYLRSGKRLAQRKAEISVHYKPVPHLMFSRAIKEAIEPNTLLMRVQPDEGISLLMQSKLQGSRICLDPVTMDFSYPKVLSMNDYERVLLDCMQGDQMLFVREDGVELAWSLVAPLLEKLEPSIRPGEIPIYPAGSDGPEQADAVINKNGRSWMPV